jgi:8-oxo-dGTP pyrophosphatase MutT (NUDIX family)
MGSGKARRRDYYHDPTAPKPTSRRPSASVVVRDGDGRVLMLQRTDNDLWTIPTGGLQFGETINECAIRECREETGIQVQVTGLVGVFSDPGHVIAYRRAGKTVEVRQPVNVCLHARPVGGAVAPAPDEARQVDWVDEESLDALSIHPVIRVRIVHALTNPDTPLVQ